MSDRKRIGVIVPATNTTVEADFNRIAPPGMTIHGQRLWLNDGDQGSGDVRDRMNTELEKAARYLAQGKMDVVAMVGTTNSFYKGPAWGDEMERIMGRGAGVPGIATSPSVVQAFRFFGAKKISVASPYPEWNNRKLQEYLEAVGFEVLNIEAEPDASRAGAQGVNDQDPEVVIEFCERACLPEADLLFCSCTAWRAMEAAEELERCLGRPVITSTQATAWRAFRTAGISESISGEGRLLELMPPVPE